LICFSFGLLPERSQTMHLPGFGVGLGFGGFGVGLGFGGFGVGLGFGGFGVGLGFGGFGVGLGLAGADDLPELPWALTLATPMVRPIATRTVAQICNNGANRFFISFVN
jgi:hypothetical protein